MQGFESVQQELEEKRRQLEQELDGLRGRASEIETDLERVHEALEALLGPTKKKAKARGGRSRKPLPTVEEVQRHIAHVREESPFADASLLERAVRALVQQGGGSLSGFKTTFAEALLTSPGMAHDDVPPALPSHPGHSAHPGHGGPSAHSGHSGHSGHTEHSHPEHSHPGPFESEPEDHHSS